MSTSTGVKKMGLPVRYRVPYEVNIYGTDLGSGKKVSNGLYLKCGIQTVAPPAYGAAIAGPSDEDVFTVNLATVWQAAILPLLNKNYRFDGVRARAIIGKIFSTPLQAIVAFFPGIPAVIGTGSPHGLTTGDLISIAGVATPVGSNGIWIVTVLSPTTLQLNGSNLIGGWSLGGTWQVVDAYPQFLYVDNDPYPYPGTPVGGNDADGLPLYATASCRRFNSGVGRAFRSRISISPLSEDDQSDGAFNAGFPAALNAGLNTLIGPIDNSGTDAGSHLMYPMAVAKSIALTTPSPYTQSDTWTAQVYSMMVQPNMGSLVRRKPKLTTPIT
jgi:hypothetical protein